MNQHPQAVQEITEAFTKVFTAKHLQKYLASIDKFDYASEHLKEGFRPGLNKARVVFENYLAFVLLAGEDNKEQPGKSYMKFH